MPGAIVTVRHGVTLLGAGETLPQDLAEALALAPTLVAADGGADTALSAGWMPRAVIGDFDSLGDAAQLALPASHLHRVADQDTTDFQKCLARIDAPFILAVGFLGGRLDHTLAAFTALVQHPEQACFLLGRDDICFLAPRQLSFDPGKGTRLSLFPMGPVQGESEGLRWPIAGLTFDPGQRIGTSNVVTGPVRLVFDQRRMLVILPRHCLRAALQAVVPNRP
ncbi:thiamine diphosphokinase [Plastorhodobacter daqingensis]|uniref:Thiamine diphosphokinase n=1 Tax=Plastorhodobacter daqingensis TaxID=1387281 RepID=A0ABW2UKV8_9RHOB